MKRFLAIAIVIGVALSSIALAGDATSDSVLRKAGIERARVLLALAAADADNLYITIAGAAAGP